MGIDRPITRRVNYAALALLILLAFTLSVLYSLWRAAADDSGRPLVALAVVAPLFLSVHVYWATTWWRRSDAPRAHPTDIHRIRLTSSPAFASATVAILLTHGAYLVYYDASMRKSDISVCRALQQLDGQTVKDRVNIAIHNAGRHDDDHLGHIAASADANTSAGHLSLNSEDDTYVASACADLYLPVPNVD
jgi:hypothetical protein